MITDEMRTADQLQKMLTDIDEELQMARDIGGRWEARAVPYYEGLAAVCRYLLGEAPSPLYGLEGVTDEAFVYEYNAARYMINDDEPMEGRDPMFVDGVYRALSWARTRSDRYTLDPLKI